jgi:putative phosphoribosyl transferase
MSLVAHNLSIPIDGAQLRATLTLPDRSEAVVLFAHGSGSSRLSPRNARVARALHERGLGTLLFDLLTSEEAHEDEALRSYRFDIELLAERLATATSWLKRQPLAPRTFAYCGASTGAAAALLAASRAPANIAAVASRGGRPDLAGRALASVVAPTLLIVGALDRDVLELNQRALEQLRCIKELAVVPGATHLFEEPGTLDEAARLAADWFVRHCTGHADDRRTRRDDRDDGKPSEEPYASKP